MYRSTKLWSFIRIAGDGDDEAGIDASSSSSSPSSSWRLPPCSACPCWSGAVEAKATSSSARNRTGGLLRRRVDTGGGDGAALLPVRKCLRLALALHNYLDVIEEVRPGAVVARDEWRARAHATWRAFVARWERTRPRPPRQRKNGAPYVAVRPKMFDESLTADVVCLTGPIHEQQHQFGKFIAHHRSQRHANAGLSVQNARSVRECVGGVAELRKRKLPANVGIVPMKSGGLPFMPVPDWLYELGVQEASAATGLHLQTHLLDLDEFVHIQKRDGTDVWGSINNIVIVHEHRAPVARRQFEASGSSWLLVIKEFDLEPEPRFPSCAYLTPCAMLSQTRVVRVMESDIKLFEHVLTVKVHERGALVARAPPIGVTFD